MISGSLKLPFKTHFRDKILALEKELQNRTNGCTIPLDNGLDSPDPSAERTKNSEKNAH